MVQYFVHTTAIIENGGKRTVITKSRNERGEIEFQSQSFQQWKQTALIAAGIV